MTTGYFDGARLAALYKELHDECAEYVREHGALTAAQENESAARLMAAARTEPSPEATANTVDSPR